MKNLILLVALLATLPVSAFEVTAIKLTRSAYFCRGDGSSRGRQLAASVYALKDTSAGREPVVIDLTMADLCPYWQASNFPLRQSLELAAFVAAREVLSKGR